jgi:thiamine biosynthesis protein ThiC
MFDSVQLSIAFNIRKITSRNKIVNPLGYKLGSIRFKIDWKNQLNQAIDNQAGLVLR